jgi:catechol 2,3-dioxygenase-like lactoylglutathione lyase family enzyme
MAFRAATIKSLDHIVLTVKSIPKTNEWYTQNLGMRSESFVSVATPEITRYSLIFGQQKINLHELGKVSIPHLLWPFAIFELELSVWILENRSMRTGAD